MGLRDVRDKRRKERERQERPRTLAELRARKQAMVIVPAPEPIDNSLAGMKKRKLAAAAAKRDFTSGGLRYGNVVQENGYWKIDVSNNDISYTMHNRYGSWMHDVEGRSGYMKEPAWVARALGTSVGQIEMAQNLIARVEVEMKARGIPTHEERLRMKEEAEKEERRKKRKKDDNTDDKDDE
jgi:hypothetical protein